MVLAFFCSLLISLLPLIVSRRGSTLIVKSLLSNPGPPRERSGLPLSRRPQNEPDGGLLTPLGANGLGLGRIFALCCRRFGKRAGQSHRMLHSYGSRSLRDLRLRAKKVLLLAELRWIV